MKVMEEIASGNTHPRLLEVMGQLQDKFANITKMQANYILFLEDTYKKLNSESPANPDSAYVDSNIDEGQFFVSVGTKNVMDNLKRVEVTDADLIITDDSLIDPSNKAELLKNIDEDITIDEDIDDDFMDLDEII